MAIPKPHTSLEQRSNAAPWRWTWVCVLATQVGCINDSDRLWSVDAPPTSSELDSLGMTSPGGGTEAGAKSTATGANASDSNSDSGAGGDLEGVSNLETEVGDAATQGGNDEGSQGEDTETTNETSSADAGSLGEDSANSDTESTTTSSESSEDASSDTSSTHSDGSEDSETGDTCSVGEIRCDGTCIDPSTHNRFCGASGDCEYPNRGVHCPGERRCIAGVCEYDCGPNEVGCGDECIDPNTDFRYCGARGDCAGVDAGERCLGDATCSDGSCLLTCRPGEIECTDCARGGHACPIYCINPDVHRRFCGAGPSCTDAEQGVHCPDDHRCVDGRCELECEDQRVACGPVCVDPALDVQHCGASGDCLGVNAGEMCAQDERCWDGDCSPYCSEDRIQCGRFCVNPAGDHNHCGAKNDCRGENAGQHCRTEEDCRDGLCTCDGVVCGGHCVDPETDSFHCGARDDCAMANSGSRCSAGELCVAGRCELEACHGTKIRCEDFCVYPDSDARYCGAAGDCQGANAGRACAGDEHCVSGLCVDMPSGYGRAYDVQDLRTRMPTQGYSAGIDARGEGLIVWAHDHDSSELWARRFDGSKLAPAQKIAEGEFSHLRLLMSDAGPAVLIHDCGDAVCALEYTPGEPSAGPSERIIEGSEGTPELELRHDRQGNIALVYSDEHGLWLLRRRRGAWEPASSVTRAPVRARDDTAEFSIDLAADDRVLVSWIEAFGGRNLVHTRVHDGSRWQSTQRVLDVGLANAGPTSPRVALADEGHQLLVWVQTRRDDQPEIDAQIAWSTRGSSEEPWSAAAIFSDPGSATQPYLRGDAQGRAVLVWRRGAGEGTSLSKSELRAATFDPNKAMDPWSSAHTLGRLGSSQHRYEFAALRDGKVHGVVSWSSPGGSGGRPHSVTWMHVNLEQQDWYSGEIRGLREPALAVGPNAAAWLLTAYPFRVGTHNYLQQLRVQGFHIRPEYGL